MAKIPEIHWAEGMFLRPQHLQMFSRQLTGMVADARRCSQPFFWGITRIEVAEDHLEAFTFSLRRFEALLKDGVRLDLPTNLRLDPRSFKDELDAAEGLLPVWLGVPVLREGEPNTLGLGEDAGKDLRYRVDTIETADENQGGSPQPLEVRKFNGRFFFGGEDREGYETLPIALIQRAGYGSNAPVLAREFIPPVTEISAWPALGKLAETILHRIEAKYRFLKAEVSDGRIALTSDAEGAWQPLFKLQIVGSFLHVLRQLSATAGVHPFALYLEWSRLAGELSIFDEGSAEALGVPLYDHDRLGECFHELASTLERLLEQILAGKFLYVKFELTGDLLVARLEEEWLTPESEIYLAIESPLDDRQVLSRIETTKIGASADLPLLKQRRLFGLDIELLKRTPGGLPSRPDLHYFAITKQGSYWESVIRHREIAVLGGIDPRLGFSLYIIRKPERALDPQRSRS